MAPGKGRKIRKRRSGSESKCWINGVMRGSNAPSVHHSNFPALTHSVSPLPPQFLNQFLHHPVWPRGLKIVCRRAVLPNRITNRFEDVSLQFWLREQPGQIPGERVAAAALRQMRIARGIHMRFLGASANQSLVAFQDHPAISESPRNTTQRLEAIGLDLLRRATQKARGLAGMRSNHANALLRDGVGW